MADRTGKWQRELDELLASAVNESGQPTAEGRQPLGRLEQTLIGEALRAAQKTMCFTLCLDLAIDWAEYRNSADYARNAPELRSKTARELFYTGVRRTVLNLFTAGVAATTTVEFILAGHYVDYVATMFTATVGVIYFLSARNLYKESNGTKYWG